LVLLSCVEGRVVVAREEVQQWLLNPPLDCSLLGVQSLILGAISVMDKHVVAGLRLDTTAPLIEVVEWLKDAIYVVLIMSSLLHELDVLPSSESS